MTKPKNRLFCRLDGLTPIVREQQRAKILERLGLLSSELVPVFEEATQTASAFLETPICILSLVVEDELRFKSAVGLSSIGLMNQLASQRKMALRESFSTYVVDSQQPLIIDDTLTEIVFAKSLLAQHYGIRAYLGVPLISTEGICLGSLEVMDLHPRQFSQKEVDFLALTARWCLREFERDRAIVWQREPALNLVATSSVKPQQANLLATTNAIEESISVATEAVAAHPVKAKLLAQLTQELRTPLTSVIGMASVLCREVYGSLTVKQREYLEIIHNSGQNLISLVDEIVSLGVLSEGELELNTTSIDIEMLCQQVINSLSDKAKQQQQSLRLSVEPGNRIWHLDKDKVKQALYYLINGVLEMSEAGGEVRVHVSRRERALNIAVWITHPWLGDGLTSIELYSQSVSKALAIEAANIENNFNFGTSDIMLGNKLLTSSALMSAIKDGKSSDRDEEKIPRDVLGLLLCCHLVELHEGRVIVQGSPESGYRYVLQLPKAQLQEEQNIA
ncbi:GAF domain-containing sensor histidine kinase [Myxosarcina sp. GI1]|uniref:sensor histidine kinase n=1 Tax=Myxosarcina sp. GI1 TaxID=1541065 RepID=UPI00068BF96A|nr:GAF domain-containing sensor histidine kinase [Myxosarcina sp. GI1]